MSWEKKINSKVYAAGVLGALGLATLGGWPEQRVILWLCVIVLATVINQWATVEILSKLVASQLQGAEPLNRKKMAWNFLLKIASLLGGFMGLLTYAREAIIWGLLLYIFMLIILGLSIKNIGQLIKKGSPK
jgi:uncharacterized membrane protein